MVSSGGCNSATEAGDCDTTVTAVGEQPDESHLLDNNAVIASVGDDIDTLPANRASTGMTEPWDNNGRRQSDTLTAVVPADQTCQRRSNEADRARQ